VNDKRSPSPITLAMVAEAVLSHHFCTSLTFPDPINSFAVKGADFLGIHSEVKPP